MPETDFSVRPARAGPVAGSQLALGYHRVLEGWAFTGLVLNLVIIFILTLRRDEFA